VKTLELEVESSDEEIIIPELEEAEDAKKHFWTDWEVAVLDQYYGKKDPNVIAKVLGRSLASVQNKAYKMGKTRR